MSAVKTNPATAAAEQPLVPFDRVGKFVRQLSHDVRNGLGAIDLQAAYLTELVADPEAVSEVKKLREMVTNATRMLQAVSSRFVVPEGNPITVPARMVIEDFRDRLAKVLPETAPQVQWEASLKDEQISVDLEVVFNVLAECFRNAFHFRKGGEPIAARAAAEGGRFVLELRQPWAEEPGTPVEKWGREPLLSTRRGGYGLGLFHARRLLHTQRGEVEFLPDGAGVLRTRVTLPLAAADSG